MAGSGGNIDLTVNSTIGGNVNLDAGDGNVDVLLNDGAGVGGSINALSGSVKTLTFNMSTTSAADYATALATLIPANASGGTFTFNGQAFTWDNFDDLVNQIVLIVNSSHVDNRDDKKPKDDTPTGGPIIPVTGGDVLLQYANNAFPTDTLKFACILISATPLEEADYIVQGEQTFTLVGDCVYLANGVQHIVSIALDSETTYLAGDVLLVTLNSEDAEQQAFAQSGDPADVDPLLVPEAIEVTANIG